MMRLLIMPIVSPLSPTGVKVSLCYYTALTIIDGGLLYQHDRSPYSSRFIEEIKALAPNADIRFHSPQHKYLPTLIKTLTAQGITCIPAARNKSVTPAMLGDLYTRAPHYTRVVLVSGSVDFAMAVEWLKATHAIPTLIAVPSTVHVSHALKSVAHLTYLTSCHAYPRSTSL